MVYMNYNQIGNALFGLTLTHIPRVRSGSVVKFVNVPDFSRVDTNCAGHYTNAGYDNALFACRFTKVNQHVLIA